MEEKLTKLIVLQHVLTKHITSSFDTNILTGDDRDNFFTAIYTYMDIFSMAVNENGIKLPKALHYEIAEWLELYGEKELAELKEAYEDLEEEYATLLKDLSKEKEEVKEDDLDISSEEEK